MKARLLAGAAVLLAIGIAGVPAGAQVRGIRAELAPVVGTTRAQPRSDVRAALVVRLPDGYHTQSDKPRDASLIPTVLTFSPPDGVTVSEVVFPPSTDFIQEGQAEPLAVFEREFAIGVRFQLAGVPAGTIDVPGRLRYQACDDKVCYAPVNADIVWTIPVGDRGQKGRPQHAEILGAIAFGTGAPPPAAVIARTPMAPPISTAPDSSSPLEKLDRFTVLAATGGYLGTEDFLTFVRQAEQGVVPRGMLEGQGPLAILLIVFLGGLALNLTPCVLPMIPINLAIIGAGAQAGSRARGFLLGGTYGAAMAVVYGVLGLVVILTAGTFGTINASPWFNLAIAALFIVLALAMFDKILIDFTKYSSMFNVGGGGRGSFLLAFGMGAVAALLAGACVAPVVIQVVVFSTDLYARGTASALALPFLLGVGMAVPWPLAGAGIAALPKPGRWMVRVKYVFGVLILGMAGYYAYTAYELFDSRRVDATEVSSSVQEKLKEGWHASLADGLALAEREQKPVLIDMWATWCKNCLTMDKTTFASAEVKSALGSYVKIKFQAEQPDDEPAKAVMQRFGAVGLPTYVILRPKAAAQ